MFVALSLTLSQKMNLFLRRKRRSVRRLRRDELKNCGQEGMQQN
jgi:hypothetical protein